MKFSKYYGLNKHQAMLDFVDIDLAKDIPLFIDPYSFSQRSDIWSQTCLTSIVDFFETVLKAIRDKNDSLGQRLLNNLSEPNETHLGLSSDKPAGRGIGGKQAQDLYEKIKKSKAAETGLLEELSDCELFVEGIGRDKISDMTTNIIRRHLIQYTQDQCKLHGITLEGTVPSGRIWNSASHMWLEEYVQLPVINDEKVILVPKATVRWSPSFNYQEYYNFSVLPFLQDYHLNAGTSLVQTLKDGRKRVTKTSLEEIHPLSKIFLSEFSIEHPEILEKYKQLMGLSKEIKDNELDKSFDERSFAQSLIEALKQIPPGPENATKYHRFIAGVLEFIFYPVLIYPILEKEIHEGRKRIDITYTNNGISGFFYRRRTQEVVNAVELFIECKNYTREIANDQLDQIAGRFGPNRGRLGFLLARKLDNRDLFIRRCKDTAVDNRGFIIMFEDSDIIEMLSLIQNDQRPRIDLLLERRFQKLVG